MLVAPRVTYPGVYIQEVKSDVRTIIGVATATTAFLGRALRGPVDEPRVINSFGDFDRTYGGLWRESNLGYAVRDFFLNGGSQAVIVRLYRNVNVVAAQKTLDEEITKADEAIADAEAAMSAKLTAANAAIEAENDEAKKNELIEKRDAARNGSDTDSDLGKAVKTHADATKAKANALSGAETTSELAKAQAALKSAADKTAAKLKLKDDLILSAVDAGEWGNKLQARVDYNVAESVATRYGLKPEEMFNLAIRDATSKDEEYIRNLTVKAGNVRHIAKVIENESKLVRVAAVPKNRPEEHPNPTETDTDKDIWGNNKFNSRVDSADFGSNGGDLTTAEFIGKGKEGAKQGLYALEHADIFNLLCIPPYLASGDIDYDQLLPAAISYCAKRRALMVVDPPSDWNSKEKAIAGIKTVPKHENAAIFFPRLKQPNPEREGQIEVFAPAGMVAGIMARTDATRGVWKAPAGLEARLLGISDLTVPMTDAENGELNPLGINCLRTMPAAGPVIWGARTLVGDDRLADQWKYLPVRRTALYIEESIYRNIQWAVFEPNDEPLWAQLRLNIGVFMHGLFRQGAFQGQSPKDAYLVKCDSTTTTQADIDKGIVNVVVGFMPLKPAEFVVIYIKQLTGQLAV